MAIWLLSMLISFVFFSCFFFRKEYSLTTTRCKNIYSILLVLIFLVSNEETKSEHNEAWSFYARFLHDFPFTGWIGSAIAVPRSYHIKFIATLN